ncbi:MAG: hypothetical protein AAFQ16_09975, partial [Pseudomonadota bacterium]
MPSLTSLVILSAVESLVASSLDTGDCGVGVRPTVEEVYPTATVLPSNLLRFYIYFDSEMDRHSAHDQIVVQNGHGDRVDDLLLDSRFELWSENARRLTIVLDPGRVKTGLSNAQWLDDGLQDGEEFVLVVGLGVSATNGCELATEFRHHFFVTGRDTNIPDPLTWNLRVPQAESWEPLEVELTKPLDHLSLAHRIRVRTPSGQLVSGRIEIGENDETWRFTPTQPWAPDHYQLVV